MFKSIRWKITLLFVLLVLATELLIGSFNIFGVAKYYHRAFSDDINEVFDADVKNDLLAAANELPVPSDEADDRSLTISNKTFNSVNMINDVLSSHSGRLGITSSRVYYIIETASGDVLKASDGSSSVNSTPTIEQAAEGSEQKETSITKPYMDYALPLINGDDMSFIVYVRDDCSTQRAVTQNLIRILLISLLLSLIISAVV